MNEALSVDKLQQYGVRMKDVAEGVDFSEKTEGVELTNAQLWARLLLMEPAERDRFLTMMQSASAAGYRCHMNDHDGMVDNYGMAMAAASVQQEEAETYYKRMRWFMQMAHYWRRSSREWRRIYMDGR